MKRALPCAVALLTLGWITYIWWDHWADASRPVWIASSLGVTAAVLGAIVPRGYVRVHVGIAAALMLILAAFAASRAVGRWPFAWDAMPDARYAAFITAIGVGVGAGLLRGAFWARWAALAFSCGSMLGGALNSYNLRAARDETAWLAAIGVLGGVIICSQLLRANVRDYFAQRAEHALWSSRDRLIRSARWAAIANFAAAPMLVLYALGQPVAAQTVAPALVLAVVIGIGSALVVARRAAGVLVVAVGGVGLVAQTLATFEYVIAANVGIAAYYAAFWLPAAMLGIAAGVVAIARARR